MNKIIKNTQIGIVLFVATIVLASTALGYEIIWFASNGGGGTSAGGPYQATFTIGQADVDWGQSETYEFYGGFWPGGPMCIVDFDDFAKFAVQWLDSGVGLSADLFGDNTVDIFDLEVLTAYWLEYCPYNWPLRLNTTPQTDNTGDGSDGELIVSSENTIVNTYAYLTGNESSGETSIVVNSASGFSVGDEILIIQMQDSAGGIAGTYEFADIDLIASDTLTLSSALANSYYSGSFDSTSATVAQIVRVPQYTDVTVNGAASITASPWDAYSGGIVVFRALGTIDVTGSINADGSGFRGGPKGPGDNQNAYQGESYKGKGNQTTTANYGAGGGGDNTIFSDYGSGGGASYGTLGTDGDSYSGNPSHQGKKGLIYGSPDLFNLYLGSGGGGGSYIGENGANGGGIIYIAGGNLVVSGSVTSNGDTGLDGEHPSGGGSGGSVYVLAYTMDIGIGEVAATGGNGGVVSGGRPWPSGPGGDGGDGRIKFD